MPSLLPNTGWSLIEDAQHILVLGFGREGKSTLQYLLRRYPEKTYTVADEGDIDIPVHLRIPSVVFRTGPDAFTSLPAAKVVIKTPGIPPDRKELVELSTQGAYVTSQADLCMERYRDQTIGVTGTKGKSTTTQVIGELLKLLGHDVRVVGNIGVPVFDVLDEVQDYTLLVFELSCHQCEGLRTSPHWAVLLSIFRDHLDYYHTMDAYIQAKSKISYFQHADDILIADLRTSEVRQIVDRSEAILWSVAENDQMAAASIVDNTIVVDGDQMTTTNDLLIPGRHNLFNIAPSILLARHFGHSRSEISEALSRIRPLSGRLENIESASGIVFYDDAVATIPEATIAGIDALEGNLKTLITGGFDRGQDFSALIERICVSSIRTLIAFPTTGEKIAKGILAKQGTQGTEGNITVFSVDSMEEAVAIAAQHTLPGESVLLSTASASFGLFRDYQERSEKYRQCIQNLEKK